MNILFLTMNNFTSISEHSIYPDLIRCLTRYGHFVTVLLPVEKKYKVATNLTNEKGIDVVRVRTGNLFDVSLIEKFFSRADLCRRYLHALKTIVPKRHFDLVLYSTPPTLFSSIVYKIKKEQGAYCYLMLKDIFPQNAVDLGMISQNSPIFFFLRMAEKKLYNISDTIGCMSPANVLFLREQNPWLPDNKVEICPNAMEILPEVSVDKAAIRKKYGIPENKKIFIYGGGLGKPQGIDFLISCIERMYLDSEVFFIIAGSGPYLRELESLMIKYPDVVKVITWLPVRDYEELVNASDVGLIFLNYRFTIPNYPSRLLLYMQAGIPILAATDLSSDIGKIAQENGYGFWCESRKGNEKEFEKLAHALCDEEKKRKMGRQARRFLEQHYSVEQAANQVLSHMK